MYKQFTLIFFEGVPKTFEGILIAISVNKVNSSKEFFNEVIDFCKKGNYNGPITLVPSMEVIEIN